MLKGVRSTFGDLSPLIISPFLTGMEKPLLLDEHFPMGLYHFFPESAILRYPQSIVTLVLTPPPRGGLFFYFFLILGLDCLSVGTFYAKWGSRRVKWGSRRSQEPP